VRIRVYTFTLLVSVVSLSGISILTAALGCSYDLDAFRKRASRPDSGSNTGADGGSSDAGGRADSADTGSDTWPSSDGGQDARPSPVMMPTGTVLIPTSGGGTASSARHRLRLTIGAPQASGTASSNNLTMTIGIPRY
jgi:hypothetical protein